MNPLFEQDFASMLRQYEDVVDDKKIFTGLIKDFFPEQAKNINLLLTAYSLGIAQDIKKTSRIGNAFAFRFVKQLMEEYGISRSNADWAVSIWCVCYGHQVLGKECEINIQTPGTGPAVKEDRRETRSYGDLFRYRKSNQGNGLSVCGFDGDKNQTIIFQNRHNNQPVIEICDEAFNATAVQEAILTDGIAFLGKGAFADCSCLHQVILPSSIREIGDRAMENCMMLKSINLPMGLERIGTDSFKGSGLRTIIYPNTLYWIGDGAFAECQELDNIILPKNIDRISARMFKGCRNIRKFEMSESVTEIGEQAFYGCKSMDMIYIPDSVAMIGDNAFADTSKQFIIQCSFGSYAEEYARKHKLKYQLI